MFPFGFVCCTPTRSDDSGSKIHRMTVFGKRGDKPVIRCPMAAAGSMANSYRPKPLTMPDLRSCSKASLKSIRPNFKSTFRASATVSSWSRSTPSSSACRSVSDGACTSMVAPAMTLTRFATPSRMTESER